jgi:uncharacterized repeat protein (TIGR01451 family)
MRVFRKSAAAALFATIFTLTLLFGFQLQPALAIDVGLSIAFDQYVATIGRTPRLDIAISNLGPNTIRSTRFQCIVQGTSLSASSISQLPSTIAPNTTFRTVQYYRAVSPGFTQVTCELDAVDTVTGETVHIVSPTQTVEVLSETRLYFNAYSATRVATVGQTVFLTALYGNRGTTPFTNISISCVELGRALEFISSTPVQTTILPGQSRFVEYKLLAVRPGFGPFACSITATDSTNGQQITLPAPTVTIEVR